MRALVLYYSNTGYTRKVAEALAEELGAELGEITCSTYLNWYGPLAMAWDIFTRHLPHVRMLSTPGAHYDLVVIGGPVWAAKAAPPVLRVLADHRAELRRVGLFVTCRGTATQSPPEPAIAEMAGRVPGSVVGARIFPDAQITSGNYHDAAKSFAATLLHSSASLAAPQPQ